MNFSIFRSKFLSRTYSKLHGSWKNLRQCDMSNVFPITSSDSVHSAVKFLENGSVIAVPTDTVYGLAVDSRNCEAVRRLYQIKGRNFNKPIAICVGRVEDISTWGHIDSLPPGLLDDLLPGPVTILLNRTPASSLHLNPGVDKVGVRVPASSFVRDIAFKFGHAIALTSANGSNRPSSLSPDEFQDFWSYLGAVFDGGTLSHSEESRAGSTIVDLTVPGRYSIVREGSALEGTLSILSGYSLREER